MPPHTLAYARLPPTYNSLGAPPKEDFEDYSEDGSEDGAEKARCVFNPVPESTLDCVATQLDCFPILEGSQ